MKGKHTRQANKTQNASSTSEEILAGNRNNTCLVGTSPFTLTNLVCHTLCRNHKSGHVSEPEACHRIRV